MHAILVYNVICTVYCQLTPQLDPFEIRIQLPFNDAACSAENANVWACAMGDRGTGSRDDPSAGVRLGSESTVASILTGSRDDG